MKNIKNYDKKQTNVKQFIKRKWNFFKFNYDWLLVYFSPFKPFLPKLYIGKVAIGTPYFLPRKFVNIKPEEAKKIANKELKKFIENNKKNKKLRVPSYDELYNNVLRRQKPVPKKIGFNFCTLGWKIKWTEKDIRYEWNPVWSFVFFGIQIALIFIPNFYKKYICAHYWECYLFYSKHTDKTKSVEERLKCAIKEFPQTWIHVNNDKKIKTNYWKLILKKKYVNLIDEKT